MRRVRTIHALRPLVSSGFLAALVSAASLYAIGREVWVAKVFANMPSIADLSALTRFFAFAFLNTATSVQALSLLTLVASLFLAREIARALAVLLSPRSFA
jgi:hypothetical protein